MKKSNFNLKTSKEVKVMKKTIIFIVFVVLALASANVCFSQSAEEFYRTNSVTVFVNGGVGGGTDFSARCLANFWAEATGGPGMKVKIKSGGGGIEGMSAVYHAKPDGLTIGVASQMSDFMAGPLLGAPAAEFASEFRFIGSFGHSPSAFLVAKDSPYKTVEDLRKAGASGKVFGASQPGSGGAVLSEVAAEILGFNGKINFGYEVPELSLSAKRGEIIAYGVPASVAYNDVKKGYSTVFAMLTLNRGEWFPDAPLIGELVDLKPRHKLMLEFLSALDDTKSYFVPPGTPQDRLEYLQRTFAKITAKPEFVKKAKMRFAVWEKPLPGDVHEAMTKKGLKIPPDQIKMVRDLYSKYK